MLAAMGKTREMQQGTSGKADFANGELDFFPFLLATATAFSQSVPGVVFLCEGVHLKLLLLPGDSFLAQTLKLVCIFFYLATQFRNIVCEKPRVTSEQQSRTQTLMCA